MSERRCDACLAGHFKGDAEIGECRYRPPTAMLQPVGKTNKLTKMEFMTWEPVAVYPAVRRDSYCISKFRPRQAAGKPLTLPVRTALPY